MNDHEGRTFDLETCKTNMSACNDVNKRHFGRKMSLMWPVSNDLSKNLLLLVGKTSEETYFSPATELK